MLAPRLLSRLSEASNTSAAAAEKGLPGGTDQAMIRVPRRLAIDARLVEKLEGLYPLDQGSQAC